MSISAGCSITFFAYRTKERRVVEVLTTASNKDVATHRNVIVVYRPLDPEMFVYRAGKFCDWKPVEDFRNRYRRIEDADELKRLKTLARSMYPEAA